MTNIFSRFDEVLKDYRFTSEVTELSRSLKDQRARYCFACTMKLCDIYRRIVKERMKEIASMVRRERTKDTAF